MDGAAPPPDPPAAWVEASASPVRGQSAVDPLERAALERCGPPEAGLAAVARDAVARTLRGAPLPAAGAIAFAQRTAGEPHPWARAWAAAGRSLPAESTLAKLDAWLAEDRTPALRRCAVASGESAGGHAIAVVAVDALADLAPLRTRARTGQWLTVRAQLRVHADDATVVILGPSGVPRRVPAWIDGDGSTLRARFALDRPGAFDVQVLATTTAGPRPVLEASVFADVEPPAHDPAAIQPASTETQPNVADGDPSDALTTALQAARTNAGEPPLARDPRLDALARAHAMRMMATRDLAHDAGDGAPDDRLRAAGIPASAAGENVAHGPSVVEVHASLWASPSHRANILQRRYDRVGVAAVRDDRGDLWAVEIFVSAP
jgi:uncharacterized protein YkwD